MNNLENFFQWSDLNMNLEHILEFGVASGSSLNAHTRWINGEFPEKKLTVRGFDTFTGLPEDWWSEIDDKRIVRKHGFDQQGNLPEIEENLKQQNDIDFYVGLFEDTIPQYIEKEAKPICFLHVDCDLYSSTKTVLYSLVDYIVPGTIIRFDEWVYWDDSKYNDHEQRAFYEWVEDFNIDYDFFKQNKNNIEERYVRINGNR